MKYCTKCGKLKGLTEYYDDGRAADGAHSQCKDCVKLATRERCASNREYYRSYFRKATQRYRIRGGELVKAKRRAYLKANRTLVNKNKRFIDARRRAAILGAEGSYTKEDVYILLNELNRCCRWCGKQLTKYHVDHIIPLSKGGSNWPSNITISCPSCNSAKKDRMPAEWEAYREAKQCLV